MLKKIEKHAIYFGISLMLIGITSALLVAYYLKRIFNNFSDEIGIGLSLFAIWLVIGSTLRTISHLDKEESFFRLLGAGVITTFLGICLSGIFKVILEKILNIELLTISFSTLSQIFYAIIFSTLLSFIITINIKIKRRFFGNLLEFILLFLVGWGFGKLLVI